MSLFLIDIHSQQQTQELSDENVQFSTITIVDNYLKLYCNISRFKRVLKPINQIKCFNKKKAKRINKEQEYNTFLLNELVAAVKDR
jgi:DNA repair protein RecN (Recombination protein N)